MGYLSAHQQQQMLEQLLEPTGKWASAGPPPTPPPPPPPLLYGYTADAAAAAATDAAFQQQLLPEQDINITQQDLLQIQTVLRQYDQAASFSVDEQLAADRLALEQRTEALRKLLQDPMGESQQSAAQGGAAAAAAGPEVNAHGCSQQPAFGCDSAFSSACPGYDQLQKFDAALDAAEAERHQQLLKQTRMQKEEAAVQRTAAAAAAAAVAPDAPAPEHIPQPKPVTAQSVQPRAKNAAQLHPSALLWLWARTDVPVLQYVGPVQ
jgi:hypothetical protein